ncbi:threonylcarbamoyl-AMP synthase [candidate division WOR-1 bacterium RIFOXYB2_FULL_42_35]|uniref:L-threonylcarbamoyladenylate synthase n=1 Tax=candidate division WOR-1 bacterium RIFOXYC2_FULL_41_25 TaxID=1802586 RepID=A0A1F4TP82_UNCSA|nr:MAG: threonylcarbamoyl-AMP synthase [candidate division WOR-1 bacterium RIFOXYA2_FULL_41_14]OGC25098.1 MAG: threonylcarbamoyl-AMP synthase [candidate division WOR-1 bacterium RIFOXYB2_FULL_42_35]OGC34498.1 MAG: threonylcarbamoyl-AMP synthase [candidate division WOR-1 bacterium RIFOXYC2_FULL_41_25]OGC43231.1 MAG: threonylcarbamoyl-AMP synthase [candidate division WOR-1 bacterium RIFOXYD2_FULL_41_8]
MSQQDKIKKAAKILKSGGIVAFPTETVFGLGALLTETIAIKQIFKIKKRPKNKPLQVLVANLKQARELGEFSIQALKLAKKNWPGPLTLVVHKKNAVPKIVVGGGNKVGLRIPKHRTILTLIKACGPIAATSANFSGEEPALNAKTVKALLGKKVDYTLPGKVKLGFASKVIDTTNKNKVLRA